MTLRKHRPPHHRGQFKACGKEGQKKKTKNSRMSRAQSFQTGGWWERRCQERGAQISRERAQRGARRWWEGCLAGCDRQGRGTPTAGRWARTRHGSPGADQRESHKTTAMCCCYCLQGARSAQEQPVQAHLCRTQSAQWSRSMQNTSLNCLCFTWTPSRIRNILFAYYIINNLLFLN